MAKVLNFNSAAATLFTETETLGVLAEGGVKFRVREIAGGLQVRPTDRSNTSNLRDPKDNLFAAKLRKEDGRLRGLVLNIDRFEGVSAGEAFVITKAKYGWYTLTKVDAPEKGVAYARVAAK